MSFIHGYLLLGLVLVGLPVLLHLMMQQKPKLLSFPAFRFLRQKQQSNRRKIQLQHWVLMALRMLFIAALLLGLSRPRLSGHFFPSSWRSLFGGSIDRPVVAIFIFDTSLSMGYRVGNQSILDLAINTAISTTRKFPEATRFAVLETGEDHTEPDWLTNPASWRAAIEPLKIRPVAIPLSRLIEQAYKRLIEETKSEEAPLAILHIFSDRTQTAWNSGEAIDLSAIAAGNNPPRVVFFDLGVDNPSDVSIDKISLAPETISEGQPFQVTVDIRATGMEYHDLVECAVDQGTALPQRQKIDLQQGQARQVSFDLQAPVLEKGANPLPFLQVTLSLKNREDNSPFQDSLAFNNRSHATVVIRNSSRESLRKMLILSESASDCTIWLAALRARAKVAPAESFDANVLSLQDLEKLKLDDLIPYRVIALFQEVNLKPSLWERLLQYVQRGGALCIVPAGQEMLEGERRRQFNEGGNKLLPASLEKLQTVSREKERGVYWNGYNASHPLMAPFHEWSRNGDLDFTQEALKPFANRYWFVNPFPESQVIVNYADGENSPAMVERLVGQGKVLLFTVVQDNRRFDAGGNDIRIDQANMRKVLPGDRDWTNYWKDSSFGYVLTLKTLSYLAGASRSVPANYLATQAVAVSLPPTLAVGSNLQLEGDKREQVLDVEKTIKVVSDSVGAPTVVIPPLSSAGNYRLMDSMNHPVAGFSINNPPEESQLAQVNSQTISKALGKDSEVFAGQSIQTFDFLKGNQPAPVEMLPLLMILMLLAMTFEGTLANWFSRKRAGSIAIAGEGAGK